MKDIIKLTQALNDLGNTQDEVYRTLKAQGFVGKPRTCDKCPVARYLNAKVGPGITVGKATGAGWDSRTIISVMLPSPVLGFIEAFDEGVYSDLQAS